jgi:hypothetical protein
MLIRPWVDTAARCFEPNFGSCCRLKDSRFRRAAKKYVLVYLFVCTEQFALLLFSGETRFPLVFFNNRIGR